MRVDQLTNDPAKTRAMRAADRQFERMMESLKRIPNHKLNFQDRLDHIKELKEKRAAEYARILKGE